MFRNYMYNVSPSWMIHPPLKMRDRALARTSVKFRQPYKLETTLDLGVLVLVARCEASLEKAWTASLPLAPYDSTSRGMHVHPSSEHLASLASAFLALRQLLLTLL